MAQLELKPLGGIDGRHFPPDGTAERVVNMRQDGMGAWCVSGGFRSLLDDAWNESTETYFENQSVGPVYSIYWFAQRGGGRQWTVFEVDTSAGALGLAYMDGQSEGFVSITSESRAHPGMSAGTQYLEVGGWLWFFNGAQPPQRWNGERVVRVGFDRRPPPLSASGPGTSSEFDGRDWTWAFDPPYWHDSVTTSLEWPGIFGQSGAPSGASHGWKKIENHPIMRGVGPRADDHDGTLEATEEPWQYGYKWAWVNDLGQESPASEATFVSGINYGLASNSTTSDTGGGRKLVAVEMPDAPDWVRGAILYRTRNIHGLSFTSDEHVRYFQHSVYASAKGVMVVDEKPDEELGALLDQTSTGVVPRGFKYAASFKGTVFVSGTAEYPDRLYFSAPGFPEQFPELNYFTIGDRASGEMTGVRATKNALVVFKSRGIYLIKGDPVNGFFAETLTEDVGCVAPNALAEVPNLGMVFLAQDGPYLLEGALENTGTPTKATWLGERIQTIWKREVNVAALMRACSVTFRPDHEVWIQVPAYGDDSPRLGLVWHYDIDAWSVREDYPASCMVVTDDHRQYLMFGDWDSTSHVGVWVYRPDIPDQNGTSITCEWRSNWIGGRSRWGRATVKHIDALVWGHGTRDLTCDMQIDRRHGWSLDESLAQDMRDIEDDRIKWGTDSFDATLSWSDYDPTIVRFDAMHEVEQDGQYRHLHARGFEFQFKLEASKVKLLGVALDYQPGSDGPKKLSENVSVEVR